MTTKDKKIALVLCIDCNKNHSLYNEKILYEEEAIQACIYWRKNAGWLKDIEIYGVCNCMSNLSLRTVSKLKKLNVILINVKEFSKYLLYNKIYALYWFEENFSNIYDYAIYIDLDLFLLREIPKELFQKKNVYLIYFNPFKKQLNKKQASHLYYRYMNIMKLNGKAFNTMFVVHFLKNRLNNIIIKKINDKDYLSFFNKYIFYDNCTYYLEEGVYDYLYLNSIINNDNSSFLKITSYLMKFFKHQHLYANNLNFNEIIKNIKNDEY